MHIFLGVFFFVIDISMFVIIIYIDFISGTVLILSSSAVLLFVKRRRKPVLFTAAVNRLRPLEIPRKRRCFVSGSFSPATKRVRRRSRASLPLRCDVDLLVTHGTRN